MKLKLLPSTISPHFFALRDSNFNASSSSSSSVHRHKRSFNFIVTSKSKKKHQNNDAKGSDSQRTPPRITSNAKQNLRILKTLKEYQKRKTSPPRHSTSYRKKKAEKPHIRNDYDSRASDSNQLVIINDVAPVMLVDGYNVCGYWMKLKKYFMNGQLEIARQLLINELISFSMLTEFKVVVVFDAMMSGFPTHKEYAAGIDIVFSSEMSADTWITIEVSNLKEDGCPDVWVVTSDHSQQESVNVAGAYVWSCKTLIAQIEASQKEADEMLQGKRSTSFQASLLKHCLDKKAVDALQTLRQKLLENESKKKIKLKF